jgi:carbonic anhydrase
LRSPAYWPNVPAGAVTGAPVDRGHDADGLPLERMLMSTTDQLLDNAGRYAADFDKGSLPPPPGRKVAVLACMDARINPYGLLGLSEGDAHVIRNAGGVVTSDAIRSLAISQRLLGTEEVILIHHTDCGMLTLSDDDFRRQLQEDTGIKPEWAAEAFSDLDEDVRQSIARIKASPFIPHKDGVRGFVYDVHDGSLREVS